MMKKTRGIKPNDQVLLIRLFAECKEVSGIWLKGTSQDIEMVRKREIKNTYNQETNLRQFLKL